MLGQKLKKKQFLIWQRAQPKDICDAPPGGAWTLTEVWLLSSLLPPLPLMISSLFLGGGGLDSVGSLKTCDFCRASWCGLTVWGFRGSGSKDGFGAGCESPNTEECCRLCWLSAWCFGVTPEAGVSEAKTFDLLRSAWQRLTSFLTGSEGVPPSFPNKLIDVFPPGGASTLKNNFSICSS